jgi:hypothetical protein
MGKVRTGSGWHRLVRWPLVCVVLLLGTGASILLTQGTGTCTYYFPGFENQSAVVGGEGGDFTLTVALREAGQYGSGYQTCPLVVRSTVSWITITNNPTSFNTNGQATINYRVDPNSGPERTGQGAISAGRSAPGYGFSGTTLTIVQRAGGITNISPSTLPAGTVNQDYSQTLTATGGTTPYTWSVSVGTPPAGLSLSPLGVLSGRPTAAGTSTFTVRVTDNLQQARTQVYTLTINPPVLAITTASLPNGSVGTAYPSTTFAASGGTPPYRQWAVTSGTLPPGLALNNSTGVLTGTPTASGSSTFTVTVADSANGVASRQYTIQIAVPGVIVTIGGISGTLPALAQPNITVNLDQDYPTDLTGTLTMTFAPNAVVTPTGNTDARFSNGQRTIDFTVPRGSRQTSVAAQTGTVAGVITVAMTRLQSGSTNLTPSGPSTATIARAAPVATSTCMAPSGTGFVITVTGYSTSREVTRANFRFTGASGVTLEGAAPGVTDAETTFGNWFRSTPSFALGSQFKLTVNFAVDNGSINSIGQAFVTLANNVNTAPEQAVTRQASCP